MVQYVARAALSGIFDLCDRLSVPDRLDTLERWEIV